MKEYKYTINGNKYEVTIGEIIENIATITVNGEDYKVEMEPEMKPEKPKVVVRPQVAAPADTSSDNDTTSTNINNAVKAPLPGVIVEVKVAVGDEVKAGDTVVILEAMKMANNLDAEKGGKVTKICVTPGQSVMEGDPLVVIE
ncbi:acetyl-CoA carboxylase biotin carboxyl carrier protein [Xylanibacter muris]|uniref:Biotin/lipoyl-binding protein n=1 Tax=Xylanibacter muris TaxID=2736290 RepID=A0ABX2ALZ2_9BACT|nr:biotin/lipoyl-containing protein [Xylanibacter muris]NPD92243.1 biotin/lipoyl-binding protein [Xylanibacter muris]